MDRFSGFEREVAQALEGQSYAIGVIEHLWCASYGQQLAPVCQRIVLDLHKRAERHHLIVLAAHPAMFDVTLLKPVFRIRLHIDLVSAAELVELVDVGRADIPR